MASRIPAIARYTVLEALGARMPAVAAALMLLALGASALVRELALTEGAAMQTAMYAAAARLAAVFTVALYVIATTSREFAEKGAEVALALDIPRWHYIAGKGAGHAVIALAIACIFSLPLWWLADPSAAATWLGSLLLELLIVGTLALFCAVTLVHPVPAMAFVTAFYLLARAMSGLRLIAEHPIAGGDSVLHEIAAGTLSLLALLVPPLDRWTQTAWLLDGPPRWSDFALLCTQTAVYVILLASATLIDFYRKEL
jgi:hypothetical protein